MSFASKQSGTEVYNSVEVGSDFLSTTGSNLPVAPAVLVDGTEYILAEAYLSVGTWLVLLQLDITGDATTIFDVIYVEVDLDLGASVLDNLLVGAQLQNTNQIELSGTYPVKVYAPINANSGLLQVKITPRFTGTAPVVNDALIRLFKIV